MKQAVKVKPTAKFTSQEVVDIRFRAAHGLRSPREEAAIFGCAIETIRKIIRRDTFQDVGGAADPREPSTREEGDGLDAAMQASLHKIRLAGLVKHAGETEEPTEDELAHSEQRLVAEVSRRVDPNALLNAWTTGGKEAAIRLIEGEGQRARPAETPAKPADGEKT